MDKKPREKRELAAQGSRLAFFTADDIDRQTLLAFAAELEAAAAIDKFGEKTKGGNGSFDAC